MTVGLRHLNELPALGAELVELTLGTRLYAHAEYLVLETAQRVLVTDATLLVEPRTRGAPFV